MASSKDFVEYVCDQVRDAGEISFTKMFGEYALYCDGKVVALICNDQVFVKKIDAVAAILGENAEEAPPYPGAKMHFLVTDLDNRQLMTRLMQAVWGALPPHKPKKAKAPKTKTAKKSNTETPAAKTAQSVAARLTAEFLALKDDK